MLVNFEACSQFQILFMPLLWNIKESLLFFNNVFKIITYLNRLRVIHCVKRVNLFHRVFVLFIDFKDVFIHITHASFKKIGCSDLCSHLFHLRVHFINCRLKALLLFLLQCKLCAYRRRYIIDHALNIYQLHIIAILIFHLYSLLLLVCQEIFSGFLSDFFYLLWQWKSPH